jgi:hypothetical protein
MTIQETARYIANQIRGRLELAIWSTADEEWCAKFIEESLAETDANAYALGFRHASVECDRHAQTAVEQALNDHKLSGACPDFRRSVEKMKGGGA